MVFTINLRSEAKKKKLPLAPAPSPAFYIYFMFFDGSSDSIKSSSYTLCKFLMSLKVSAAYYLIRTLRFKLIIPFFIFLSASISA